MISVEFLDGKAIYHRVKIAFETPFFAPVLEDIFMGEKIYQKGMKNIFGNLDVSSLFMAFGQEIYFSGNRPFQEDLDSIPMPAWDLINIPQYSKGLNINGFLAKLPYATLFTSRACPYKCIYCHAVFGKQFRAQSPERVLEEVELLYRRFGVREIHVFDDVFNFDRNRVMSISEMVLKRGIKMKFAFPNGVRGDIMTRDVIQALIRAGTYCITYAIETASPRLQRLIKKNLNIDRANEAIKWTFEEGAIPCGFFMFGFPTETREEMEQTIQFARNSKLLKALFFSVVPFPRTDLFKLVEKTYPELKLGYNFSPAMYYWSQRPYYNDVSGIDVWSIQARAWRVFYMTPWRVPHFFRRLPKNTSFFRVIYEGVTSSLLGLGRIEEQVEISSN